MEEDEEVRIIMFPQLDDFQPLTNKSLSQFLAKRGFSVEQCRVLEGKFLSFYVLAVNSMFL